VAPTFPLCKHRLGHFRSNLGYVNVIGLLNSWQKFRTFGRNSGVFEAIPSRELEINDLTYRTTVERAK
jgi:hypothetical protein